MTTPAPRHFCPRCRASYAAAQAFCSECGADMLKVSAIDLAAARDAALGETGRPGVPAVRIDRRVSASNQAWLGTVVDGRYRVLEVIGRGGMGVVYKVEHVRMGKIAAMKVLHRDLVDDAEAILRFEREAAAVSRLHHPNAVQVFDFGAAGDALYLIMEYVRGQDLGAIVDRDGPLPFARAAPILVQVLGALAEAHERGIVHRDLKPDNVLVTRTTGGRDFAKVLDFGLAKIARGADPGDSDHGQIVGTPYFMAPEQIRGDQVDARTDLYAMGALMYRVLTGRYVHTAATAVGVLTKHLTVEPELPSRVHPAIAPEIDALVMRALTKDPTGRWPSAATMIEAIEDAYAQLVGDRASLAAQRAQPGSSGRRGRAQTEDDEPLSELRLQRSDIDAYERSLRRGRWMMLGVATAVTLALVGAGVWWTTLRATPPVTHEREPNDALARANRVAGGTTVTGYFGRRRSPTEPDVDFYRWPRSGPGVVTVKLTAVPNVDAQLVLRDQAGVVLSVDEQAVGGDERVFARRVHGELSIEVSQVMTSALPVENVSDRYRLELIEEPDQPGWEREPNGDRSDAVELAPGLAMRGRLDSRTDVDALRWTGPTGPATIEVAAPAELPLTWRGPDGVDRPAGRVTVPLTTGDVVTLRRSDRDGRKGEGDHGERVWTVTIVAGG